MKRPGKECAQRTGDRHRNETEDEKESILEPFGQNEDEQDVDDDDFEAGEREQNRRVHRVPSEVFLGEGSDDGFQCRLIEVGDEGGQKEYNHLDAHVLFAVDLRRENLLFLPRWMVRSGVFMFGRVGRCGRTGRHRWCSIVEAEPANDL